LNLNYIDMGSIKRVYKFESNFNNLRLNRMKFVVLLICLFALTTFAVDKKHHLKKKLPSTPQGYALHNHFGADSYHSPYGPQPRLVKKTFTHTRKDGSVEEKTVATVESLPEGVSYKSSCDVTKSAHFQICFGIRDCDLCNAASGCGWCGSTNSCLPGDINGAVCPNACFHTWIFTAEECTNKVRSGHLSNIAPEATGLVTANWAKPIAEVHTALHTKSIVKTPVLLGNEVIRNEVTNTNPVTGQVLNSTTYLEEKPILGVVHQLQDVTTHHKQYINLENGKRINTADVKAKFGTARD